MIHDSNLIVFVSFMKLIQTKQKRVLYCKKWRNSPLGKKYRDERNKERHLKKLTSVLSSINKNIDYNAETDAPLITYHTKFGYLWLEGKPFIEGRFIVQPKITIKQNSLFFIDFQTREFFNYVEKIQNFFT